MPQALERDCEPEFQAFQHKALIALGGNVASLAGPPEKTLLAALQALATDSVRISNVSRLFETPCFPVGAGADYINAAAILSTSLSPTGVLAHLHQIEALFGRERRQRWASRTLDLDLLAYDDMVWPDPATYKGWRDLSPPDQKLRAPDQLILPHPRMHERGFVLVPLADVAPDWCHPVLGLTVVEMLATLDPGQVAQVRAVEQPAPLPE